MDQRFMKQQQMFGKPRSLLKNTSKSKKEPKIIEGINLKNLNDQDSQHSSVFEFQNSRQTSMRNIVDSFSKDFSASGTSSLFLTDQNTLNANKKSVSKIKLQPVSKIQKGSQLSSSRRKQWSIGRSSISKSSVSVRSQKPAKQIAIEQVFEKYIDTEFMKSFLKFMNKDWKEQQQQLLQQKRFQAMIQAIMQKSNFFNSLVQDFFTLEYDKYQGDQCKLMCSIIFKQSTQTIKDLESIILQIVRKIPQDKILRQQQQIDDLFSRLLQIFDPKFINSSSKMKQRFSQYFEDYTYKKNNLRASVATKLKGTVDFLVQVENYLTTYQREVIKLKAQLQNIQTQKKNLQELLDKKVNFTPIQINYQKIKMMKDNTRQEFFKNLEHTFIKFHEQKHLYNNQKIATMEKDMLKLREIAEQKEYDYEKVKEELEDFIRKIPKKTEASTQVFFISSKKALQSSKGNNLYDLFLENVVTPFTFNYKITAYLINIIIIDKVLYDYEIIRNRLRLKTLRQFVFEWFIIRTGNKHIAQIFLKNFLFSVKQLKGSHKRFNIFSKLCGFTPIRKKNIQQDLEFVFFQTQLAWYYFVKVALIYRKKVNDNPSGYQITPPLQCQSIFKIPLRKTYELIQEFLISEEIQVPSDLHTRVDQYCINEISKYKSNDEKFQKQRLQEIHILREINFDMIVGFLLEYIAQIKCSTVEKLLRVVNVKQKQSINVLGYSQFEHLYRRFYKEKRSRIQQIYMKFCLVNQHDMLDIQNAQIVVNQIIEDQTLIRGIFEKIQSLNCLIITEKIQLKADKRIVNPNSFENFRQRYYAQYYDFFSTTNFLEDIFKIIKNYLKKKLKGYSKNEQSIDKLIDIDTSHQLTVEQINKLVLKNQKPEKQNSEESEQSVQEQEAPKQIDEAEEKQKFKNDLEKKLEQWGKIIVRVPHFPTKILTIDQILVHNMRRKEMIQATQFAWRTLRDLLILVGRQ